MAQQMMHMHITPLPDLSLFNTFTQVLSTHSISEYLHSSQETKQSVCWFWHTCYMTLNTNRRRMGTNVRAQRKRMCRHPPMMLKHSALVPNDRVLA